MTSDRDHRIYLTQVEDGSWLAASISKPWFCLSAPTEDEALVRAQSALDFWCENRDVPVTQNLERTVAPFSPKRVQSLRPTALCA